MCIRDSHDSDPTAYGANDNASGVAALLYTAQALRELPTDTEIRFVSFTDEENGKKGSAAYLASLDEEERSRIVGDIQFCLLYTSLARRALRIRLPLRVLILLRKPCSLAL